MRRSWTVGALVAITLAGSGTAIAFPFPDPAGPLLRMVAQILGTIEQVELEAQRIVQQRIDVIESLQAFPKSVTGTIGLTLSRVTGIRDEVLALRCAWQFTNRTDVLVAGYFQRARLCKDTYQLAWGTPAGHWNADMQEMQDYAATMTANVISDRIESERGWELAFPGNEAMTAYARRSPGEANRDEAVSLAGAGVVADSNGEIAAQHLMVEQLDREMDRFEEKKEHDMAQFILLEAIGYDPLHPPAVGDRP